MWVEESDFTGSGFYTLKVFAKKRADDRDGGLYEFSTSDRMVRVPPVVAIA